MKKMNISMVHFRVGETDGVSLEMDKWRLVLKKQFGHNVIYLAGALGQTSGYSIPELSLDHQNGRDIRKRAFSSPLNPDNEIILKNEIQSQIKQIVPKILKFIAKNEINCFIPNNMFSLPLNIPASLALLEVIKTQQIPTISHNHDFYWERTIYNPSCALIQQYLQDFFPAALPNMQHIVINSLAKKALKKRKKIDSTVVPNVFYFEESDWKKDSFNLDIRSSLNINKNDIIMLQATRIVDRKGIELVIDLISELNKEINRKAIINKPLYDGRRFHEENQIILVMPNLVEDNIYRKKLEEKCKELKVDYRFCNRFFAHQRSSEESDSKIYNLWDIYCHSDIVSYPSLLEGWGNQFLEGVKAKIPIIVFEYDVYKEDIGPLGFNVISLGSEQDKPDIRGLVSISQEKLHLAVQQTIHMLQDNKVRKKITTANYQIGVKELSISALGHYLRPLLTSF